MIRSQNVFLKVFHSFIAPSQDGYQLHLWEKVRVRVTTDGLRENELSRTERRVLNDTGPEVCTAGGNLRGSRLVSAKNFLKSVSGRLDHTLT
jgi:hypothetical protein